MPQKLRAVLVVETADHLHVNASGESEARGLAPVGGVAVRDHLLNGRVVAHDEAIELPLAAQNFRERERVPRRRHAVEVVERTHQGAYASVHGGVEWRQIDFAQTLLAHVHCVVVAPRFGSAVCDEVFGAGDDAVLRRVVRALKAAHACARERRAEVRVFARALCDAPPARVARDVNHRGESPVDASRARLCRGDMGRALGGRGVEARGLAQGDWEDRSIAVNNVEAEDERNLQTRPLDRRAL